MADGDTSNPRTMPSRGRRGWRRWLVTAVIFLILGAIVNVAVAWGCVLWADTWMFDGGRPIEKQWPFLAPEGWECPECLMVRRDTVGYTMLMGMSDVPSNLEPEYYSATQVVVLTGWPLHSMYTLSITGNSLVDRRVASSRIKETTLLEGGLPAPVWVPGVTGFFVRIPTHPLWIGFGINTILYATVLSSAWIGPPWLRRRRRIRRSLCPACGYPVGTGPVCTECGEVLVVKKGAVNGG